MVFCSSLKLFPRRALQRTPSHSARSSAKSSHQHFALPSESEEAFSQRAMSYLELRVETMQASAGSEWEWVDLRRWDLKEVGEEDEEGDKAEGEGGGMPERAEESSSTGKETSLVGLGRVFLPHPPAPFAFSDPRTVTEVASPSSSSSSGSILSKSDTRRSFSRRLSSPPSSVEDSSSPSTPGIKTILDHEGRRVLTSRRRLSHDSGTGPIPVRRIKKQFGIGDEDSGEEELRSPYSSSSSLLSHSHSHSHSHHRRPATHHRSHSLPLQTCYLPPFKPHLPLRYNLSHPSPLTPSHSRLPATHDLNPRTLDPLHPSHPLRRRSATANLKATPPSREPHHRASLDPQGSKWRRSSGVGAYHGAQARKWDGHLVEDRVPGFLKVANPDSASGDTNVVA